MKILNNRNYVRSAAMIFLIGCAIPTPFAAEELASKEFVSASTLEEVQSQMRKLPTDDIWWTVNGEDMAWNFKNLHMIFPTVTVYRQGPVQPLSHNPMHEIGEYMISTPEGRMTFDDFIVSDLSLIHI